MPIPLVAETLRHLACDSDQHRVLIEAADHLDAMYAEMRAIQTRWQTPPPEPIR